MGRLSGIYYGWVIAGTLAVTETVSWGIIYYAFSVFLVPMSDELGWSAAQMTGAYSVALLLSGLAAPFVGRWIDRRGARALMTAGSVLGVLLVIAWSRVDNLVAYYLVWAGMGLAMSATLYEPAFAAVTAWFERYRARAILVVTLVAGFASTIFLPLSGWLVDRMGWRDALVALAVILAVLTIPPHALILRRRPEDLGLPLDGITPSANEPERVAARPKREVDVRQVLRDRVFWWMALSFSLETFSLVAVAVYLIPYLTERGDGAQFAAIVTGLIGAAQVGARVLATLFGNRLSEVALTAFVFALQGVAVILLMQWESRAGVLVSVVLLGAGRGVVTLMRPSLIVGFYGRTHFGAISGTLAFFLTGARALAPVAAGLAYGWTGEYGPVLWGLATISLLAAATMVMVGRVHGRAASAHAIA